MAITIPGNADTTRYSYQVGTSTGVTFAANAIPSTNIAAGDHFVVFTGHSDNAGGSQSAPSGWTHWFEYINADGDDFTLHGYYHTVTSGEASGGSASAAFTFGESEEFTAVMFHVEGADDTDFDDQVTPVATNTQNTDSPTPAAITTNTDGAVVIVLDANQSDAGHLNPSFDRSGYFQPIGPAGYTIEDGGYTSGTNAEGAPGRLEMGTGFADAQMSWGWKTVATAGTETPGNWSQSGGNGSEYINLRDHKTVTMVIKPASVGGATPTPAALTVTGTYPAVAASGKVNASATCTVLAVTGLLPVVVATSGAATTLTALAVSGSFPAVVTVNDVNASATLAALPVQGSFPVAVGVSGGTATLTVHPVTGAFPQAVVDGEISASATLTVLAVAGSFPAVLALSGAAATITALPVSASFPTVVAQGDVAYASWGMIPIGVA